MSRFRGLWTALCLALLVAGCASRPPGGLSGGDETPAVLAPQPLRGAGLALHRFWLSTGAYALAERLREPGEAVEPNGEAAPGKAARSPKRGALQVTWYGHSTALLRLGKTTILTDPILAGAVSPWSPLPVLYGRPALQLDGLPKIDAVVISHGDFDHLHEPSLRALATRFPDAVIVVPDRLQHLVADDGFRHVHALPLNRPLRVGAVTVTGLPAVHATRRNLLGIRDGAAFSWEFADPGHRVLFIGDTGYGPVFSQIGRRRGPYDLVLVPIGASEPRHLVVDMHISPEEAVRLADDLRARVAIGIHWGTFALSPERRNEPARRFLRAGATRKARTLAIGETASIP